jgi:hypothetical protein
MANTTSTDPKDQAATTDPKDQAQGTAATEAAPETAKVAKRKPEIVSATFSDLGVSVTYDNGSTELLTDAQYAAQIA